MAARRWRHRWSTRSPAARTILVPSAIALALRIAGSAFSVPPIPLAPSAGFQSRASAAGASLRGAAITSAPGGVALASVGPGAVYPPWVFEWARLWGFEPTACALALFASGVLCSAAGIGGGGIYVSLLMVPGGLTPRDAVPLSKGVVFFGSMASLVLNMRRTAANKKKPALINYGVCRIVVPAALVGTLFGVLINQTAGERVILTMLSAILVFMAVMTCRTTLKQYRSEVAVAADQRKAESGTMPASPCKRQDVVGGVCMLLLVVLCGALRFHMGGFRYMLDHPWFAQLVLRGTLVVPMLAGIAATAYGSCVCVGEECWMPVDVAKYVAMAAFTGCFAGLVGIGGGLIFSPFFLVMGLDPSVAVATSSTCVIFTSSSTTLQYLLTGRIIMSLAVFYGMTNLLASYCGTSLVHFLQDKFAGRRSYISGIVAFAVVLSTGLVGAKLLSF